MRYWNISAAQATNKSIPLGVNMSPKSRHHPQIVDAQKNLLSRHENLKILRSSPAPDPDELHSAKNEHSAARSAYRQSIRTEQKNDAIARDQKLLSLRSSNSGEIVRAVKVSSQCPQERFMN